MTRSEIKEYFRDNSLTFEVTGKEWSGHEWVYPYSVFGEGGEELLCGSFTSGFVGDCILPDDLPVHLSDLPAVVLQAIEKFRNSELLELGR